MWARLPLGSFERIPSVAHRPLSSQNADALLFTAPALGKGLRPLMDGGLDLLPWTQPRLLLELMRSGLLYYQTA